MSTNPARRNVELKARLGSLDQARSIAAQVATERLEDQHQVDTYFDCRQGRLKLREINGRRSELIWYDRPDQAEPKPCRYYRIPLPDPALVKQALEAALGIRAIVEKHREIYLAQNVRIHLDRVAGLGTFLEFEAVLDPETSVEQGRQQVEHLRQTFGIPPSDLLTGSYADEATR
jgi:adenylate cyclase, class 2